MKRFLLPLLGLVAVLAASVVGAQTYPTGNPVYIPTAQLAATTITASTGDYVFVTNGVGTTSLRITGSRTSMTAAVQGSNESTSPNYTTIPVYPVGGGASATSITANGFWTFNTAGFTRVRLHVTAHTIGGGTGITAQMAATPGVSLVTVTPAAGSTVLGTVGIDQTTPGTTNGVQTLTGSVTTPVAATTGGASLAHVLSAATTNSTNIKASAGTLYSVTAVNTNATTAFLKFYDKATGPTCNSDAVLATYALVQNIPVSVPLGPVGAAFVSGIGLCITGAAADADNTAATTGITVSVTYK